MPFKSVFPKFLADRRGNVAIIFAFMLVPMVLAVGGAVDLARHEAIRLELQNGLDRGVLAAASMSQTEPTLDTLQEYIETLPYHDEVVLEYDAEASLNTREIRATAHYSMRTAFLTLAGIDVLNVNVQSAATEGKHNLELSLILDLSGSMQGNRIKNLKLAAQQFIDQMLTEQTKDFTTISIVPYAGEVNVGYAMFNRLGGIRPIQDPTTVDPGYVPSCFDMKDTIYGTSTIPNFNGYPGVPTFTAYNYGRKDLGWWLCPGDKSAISYFSNDATYLKQQLAAMVLYDGTGTQVGMQWGYMLLNPAATTIVDAAIATGAMSADFEDRPAAFDDPETMKILVLMTDGDITPKFRPRNPRQSGDLPADNHQYGGTEKALTDVCATAKSNNVIVYTIGFEIPANSNASKYMRNCATTPEHYYAATSTGIGNVFSAISTSILSLRLTL